jgi:hypothetical protein
MTIHAALILPFSPKICQNMWQILKIFRKKGKDPTPVKFGNMMESEKAKLKANQFLELTFYLPYGLPRPLLFVHIVPLKTCVFVLSLRQ